MHVAAARLVASALCRAQHAIPRQVMPDTPALTQSDNREILQGVKENANALHTECKLVPAADLPGLAANLAEVIEWGPVQCVLLP